MKSETLGKIMKIQKEEENKSQTIGLLNKLKTIMLKEKQLDGERVLPKVIKMIQVLLLGEKMELMSKVSLTMTSKIKEMIGVELKLEMIGKTSEITNLKREELQLIQKLRDWVMLTLQQPVITMEAEILLMERKLVELELITKIKVNLEETKMNGEK